jgi:hypothetical protein
MGSYQQTSAATSSRCRRRSERLLCVNRLHPVRCSPPKARLRSRCPTRARPLASRNKRHGRRNRRWFENKKRAIPTDELKQINPARVACRLSVGDTPSPWHRVTDCFRFAGAKPILVLVAGEDLKHRLLVNDCASERIHEANVVIHVRADEWVGLVITRQEFVDDYSFINRSIRKAPHRSWRSRYSRSSGEQMMVGTPCAAK